LVSLERFRALRVQSGLTMPLPKFLVITTGVVLGLMLGGLWFGLPLTPALLLFTPFCLMAPIIALRYLRKRRHKLFGIQLPEALELITRSLKAGHPVPVAVAMVAREMADPIGSEFGVVADEVTYGSDLVSALNNLYDRVGHEDLPLFVTAVSIQTSSGGNLREILDGLSTTIRGRGKLRRKVRAISTEGRMSAYILTAVPVMLGVAMTILMPEMYGTVMDEALTWYMLGGSFVWLVIGNIAMFKMSNFRM
jgi:tight adherence protein B